MKTRIIPSLREGSKFVMWSEDGWLASTYSLARLILLDGQNRTHGHVKTFNQGSHATSSATIYRVVP